MKYRIRVERQSDIISVSCNGDVVWSASGIDGKMERAAKLVRNFKKFGTPMAEAKQALERAFPPPKTKVAQNRLTAAGVHF